MRYNFHEQLENVKKDPSYILPEDINKPVIDFLVKIECYSAIAVLGRMQRKIMYGTLELNRKGINGKITIQVDCGMADGWKESEIISDSNGWEIVVYKTIRNSNLDKKRVTKGV